MRPLDTNGDYHYAAVKLLFMVLIINYAPNYSFVAFDVKVEQKRRPISLQSGLQILVAMICGFLTGPRLEVTWCLDVRLGFYPPPAYQLSPHSPLENITSEV